MSGRPQVPSRFVGGPLRGPPPPRGWNFFIVRRRARWLRWRLRAVLAAARRYWRRAPGKRRRGVSSAVTGVAGVNVRCFLPSARAEPRDALLRCAVSAEPTQRRSARAGNANRLGAGSICLVPVLLAYRFQTGHCTAMDDCADRRTSHTVLDPAQNRQARSVTHTARIARIRCHAVVSGRSCPTTHVLSTTFEAQQLSRCISYFWP